MTIYVPVSCLTNKLLKYVRHALQKFYTFVFCWSHKSLKMFAMTIFVSCQTHKCLKNVRHVPRKFYIFRVISDSHIYSFLLINFQFEYRQTQGVQGKIFLAFSALKTKLKFNISQTKCLSLIYAQKSTYFQWTCPSQFKSSSFHVRFTNKKLLSCLMRIQLFLVLMSNQTRTASCKDNSAIPLFKANPTTTLSYQRKFRWCRFHVKSNQKFVMVTGGADPK